MGRLYSVSFEGVAVTAAQDLFELLAPSDAIMVVHAIEVSQSSDAGDAESEQLRFSLTRVTGSPTSGSGGSSATPRPLEGGDAAAGITAEVNNTTVISGGSSVDLAHWSRNVMEGLSVFFTPETRPVFSPSTYCVLSLDAAPGDSLTMQGTIIVEEIGG